MQSRKKQMMKFLLFRWKQLVPYASVQRTFFENIKDNENTPAPFNFNVFNPMAEIDIIKTKIINNSPMLSWAKSECELPESLCDDDLGEIYSRYNYMLIEKIKKKVHNR